MLIVSPAVQCRRSAISPNVRPYAFRAYGPGRCACQQPLRTRSRFTGQGALRGRWPSAVMAVASCFRPPISISCSLSKSEEDLASYKGAISRNFSDLFGIRIRVSQSARTIAECVKLHDQNLELNISLLDLRYLCGDAAVFSELERQLPQFFQRHGDTLVQRLSELTRARHAKYNETVYHLEPNVKEIPGGIRDLHFLAG